MNVDFIRKIESGSYGEVWLMKTKEGKQFIRKYAKGINGPKALRNEYTVMSALQDVDGIPQVWRLNETEQDTYMDMEYIWGVKDVQTYNNLSLYEAYHICYNVIKILFHVHALGYVHRDIKQENVLYNFDTGNVYLIDWGFGMNINETDSTVINHYGTMFVNPPEMFGDKYEDVRKIDIWQMCVMLFEMLTYKDLFDSTPNNNHKFMNKGMKCIWTYRGNLIKCNWNRKYICNLPNAKELEELFDSVFKYENERCDLGKIEKYVRRISSE